MAKGAKVAKRTGRGGIVVALDSSSMGSIGSISSISKGEGENRYEPAVRRRVLVPANATFADLNDIILEAMGWLGCHLWEFEVGDELYGPRGPDLDWAGEPPRDARKTRPYEALGGGATFRHLYVECIVDLDVVVDVHLRLPPSAKV
ncbi:MAG: plasmid pRiA4b ORF-3 family protein [Limnochordales bacterium]|nr:plasmid pRiA4b ORF-3 family protein [Limnochordales bacterium]